MSTARRYAAGTKVEGEQSRKELERLLHRYEADGFGYAWDNRIEVAPLVCQYAYCNRNRAPEHAEECKAAGHPMRKPFSFTRSIVAISFRFRERRIRLEVPMPADHEHKTVKQRELATRQRWRALVLVVKAKLEAVASGISTLEHEFLANVVMPNGKTIGESMVPRLTDFERDGLLLPEHRSDA